MKSVKKMVVRGQARYFQILALQTRKYFDLDIVKLQLVGIHTTALFCVRTKNLHGLNQICWPG
jgi:hypothetical protein